MDYLAFWPLFALPPSLFFDKYLGQPKYLYEFFLIPIAFLTLSYAFIFEPDVISRLIQSMLSVASCCFQIAMYSNYLRFKYER